MSRTLFVLLLWGGFTLALASRLENADLLSNIWNTRDSDDGAQVHASRFTSQEPFERAFSSRATRTPPASTQVISGIIPHHLLAAPLLAFFFQGLAKLEPSTVVLLAPNHHNRGRHPIALSRYRWKTPYGILSPNSTIIEQLRKIQIADSDEQVFEFEHSIYSITPFIKRAFPNVRFIPIVLQSAATTRQAQVLGEALATLLPPDALVLASVDFSHDVSPEKAREQDRASLEVITTFDLERSAALTTDSNQAVVSLLTFLEKRGVKDALILETADSATFTPQESLTAVTSYASLYFARDGLTNPALTLEALFSPRPPSTDSQTDTLTILVTGDVSLARSVNVALNQPEPVSLFSPLATLLKAADLTLVNLESPLVSDCLPTHTGMKLCGKPEHARELTTAGVYVASLANNHALDYGTQGLEQTVNALKTQGILTFREGEVVQTTVKDQTLAFLGFEAVNHRLDEPTLERAVRSAKQDADILIVIFHWGNEYTADPSQYQKQLAHLTVESGADLVVGNHPHWVQAVEVYRNRLIVYSHGNFVFDQLWSVETREGLLGKYSFRNGTLVAAEFIPIWINDRFQPTLADPERAATIRARMLEASQKLLPTDTTP